ncbi:MAG: S-layer homology domain-containing protein, partial [Filifactor alocis]|nr:S-layer homology domain-containing protein [Filifactor alocis]
MKRKKVAGALLLSLSMMCSTVATYANDFNDMKGHWASIHVNDVVAKGILKGYDDNTFRPARPVTKIESIIMISNLFPDSQIEEIYSKNKSKYQATMTKSKIPPWAQKYIVFGVEKKLFPEKSIPYFMTQTKGTYVQSLSFRQEYAMLLVNALGLNKEFSKVPNVKYKDVASIDGKALPYIEVLGKKGIIQTTGKFNPKSKITRAESAVMISKSYPFSQKAKWEGTKLAHGTQPVQPV